MFQPKNDQPMWEMIYNHVIDQPTGTIVTLQELSDVINGDITHNRSSIYKARREMAKTDKRYLVSVTGKGYKVVEGVDQLRQAERRHDSAKRQVQLANFEAININTSEMTTDEKSRFSSFLAWNSMAMNTLSSNTEVIAKVNDAAGIANSIVSEQLKKLQSQLGSYAKQMADLREKIK